MVLLSLFPPTFKESLGCISKFREYSPESPVARGLNGIVIICGADKVLCLIITRPFRDHSHITVTLVSTIVVFSWSTPVKLYTVPLYAGEGGFIHYHC